MEHSRNVVVADCLYIALFSALEHSLLHVIVSGLSLSLFIAHFEYPRQWCTYSIFCLFVCLFLVVISLVLRETAAVSARSVYTTQPLHRLTSLHAKPHAYGACVLGLGLGLISH